MLEEMKLEQTEGILRFINEIVQKPLESKELDENERALIHEKIQEYFDNFGVKLSS